MPNPNINLAPELKEDTELIRDMWQCSDPSGPYRNLFLKRPDETVPDKGENTTVGNFAQSVSDKKFMKARVLSLTVSGLQLKSVAGLKVSFNWGWKHTDVPIDIEMTLAFRWDNDKDDQRTFIDEVKVKYFWKKDIGDNVIVIQNGKIHSTTIIEVSDDKTSIIDTLDETIEKREDEIVKKIKEERIKTKESTFKFRKCEVEKRTEKFGTYESQGDSSYFCIKKFNAITEALFEHITTHKQEVGGNDQIDSKSYTESCKSVTMQINKIEIN